MSNSAATIDFSGDAITRLVRLGAILAAVLALLGCGKKAPPMVPQSPPLLAVSDLQAMIHGAGVKLTWQHLPENGHATAYLVLRAQAQVNQPQCPGCPQVFQKVQTLRLSRSRRRQAHTMTFNQNVSDGYRYTYSVRPLHVSGRQGPDSNFVEIEKIASESPEPGRNNS